MIQFTFTSDSGLSRRSVVGRFPLNLGRSPQDHIQLEADGVWPGHLTISLLDSGEMGLTSSTGNVFLLDGEPLTSGKIRIGGTFEIGSVVVRTEFAEPPLTHARLYETFFWTLLVTILAAELVGMFKL